MEKISNLPLAVDLDGSLITGDLSEESAIKYILKKPWGFIVLLFMLILGRAKVKRFLADRINIDASVLPYRTHIIEWLKEQRAAGRELLLVSGSDQQYVDLVVQHLKIFSSGHGSDGSTNLIGRNKASFLVSKFGKGGFEYLGNSRVDLHVWSEAAGAVVVSNSESLRHKAQRVQKTFTVESGTVKGLFKAVRLHQWSKSLLVFVPAVAAHQLFNFEIMTRSFLAFICFGLISSTGYILNDISDLDADRNSAKKRNRPFAAGQVKTSYGILLALVLFCLCFGLAVQLSLAFATVLLGYFLTVLVYSGRLKSQIIVDLVLLSGFYCLRVLAGGLATGIDVSRWLLLLCVFFFFSLACIKRYVELLSGVKDSQSGRGYRNGDYPVIAAMGVGSGFISTLVVALWANSPEVTKEYAAVQFLWLLVPLLMYWLGRIWILAGRGEIDHDPVVFALRDKLSYLVYISALFLLFFAARMDL